MSFFQRAAQFLAERSPKFWVKTAGAVATIAGAVVCFAAQMSPIGPALAIIGAFLYFAADLMEDIQTQSGRAPAYAMA